METLSHWTHVLWIGIFKKQLQNRLLFKLALARLVYAFYCFSLSFVKHFAMSVLLRSYINTLIIVISPFYLNGQKSQRCTGKQSKSSPGGGATPCDIRCVAVIIGEYVKTE